MTDRPARTSASNIDLSDLPDAAKLAAMERDSSPAAGAYPRPVKSHFGVAVLMTGVVTAIFAAVSKVTKTPAGH